MGILDYIAPGGSDPDPEPHDTRFQEVNIGSDLPEKRHWKLTKDGDTWADPLTLTHEPTGRVWTLDPEAGEVIRRD